MNDIIISQNNSMTIQTSYMHYAMKPEEIEHVANSIIEAYSNNEIEKIIFNVSAEGLPLGIMKPVDSIVRILEQSGIPRSKFCLTSGGVECPENREYYSEHCAKLGLIELNIEFNNLFQTHSITVMRRENLYNNHSRSLGFKNKKFLCFNRNVKYHRLFITAETIKRGLLDKAYFSMYVNGTESDGMGNLQTDLKYYENWHEYLPNLGTATAQVINDNIDLFPIRLSLHNNLLEPHGLRNDLHLFDDSYFGVITESKFFTDSGNIDEMKTELSMDCYFFTEKTYKFIATKMPFIFVGFKNSLSILRKMGYKTFHPYINESYDSIENDEERLVAIMDEIERLCNLSDNEWIDIEKNLLPIVNHNYGVLTKQ